MNKFLSKGINSKTVPNLMQIYMDYNVMLINLTTSNLSMYEHFKFTPNMTTKWHKNKSECSIFPPKTLVGPEMMSEKLKPSKPIPTWIPEALYEYKKVKWLIYCWQQTE